MDVILIVDLNGKIIVFNLIYATAFIVFITTTFVSCLKSLELCMGKMARNVFEPIECDEPGQDEIGLLVKGINNAVQKINTLIEDVFQTRMRELEIENEKRLAELSALQSQINLHFIYNVLESIRMKSVIKGERETATVIKHLSRLFRRLVNQSDNLVPVAEELEVIHEYAKIEEYRFGKELTINIEVDDAVLNALIPKMILQVLLENACIHGIERISGKKYIHIKLSGVSNWIYGSVSDNGKGMSEEKIKDIMSGKELKSGGVGLQNILRRLNLCYGENFEFKIERPESGGLTVSFKVPRMEKNN